VAKLETLESLENLSRNMGCLLFILGLFVAFLYGLVLLIKTLWRLA
jgi:flagellar biogenesis protein FliO